MGVDLELGHQGLLVALLDVEGKTAAACGTPQAQRPRRGRQHHRLGRRDGRRQVDGEGHPLGLGLHHQGLAAEVFMLQGQTVEIQRSVVRNRFVEQLQRALQRLQQVGAGGFGVRQIGGGSPVLGLQARVPPGVGLGLDGRQPHGLRRAGRAQVALGVAADPALGKPAGIAGQPERLGIGDGEQVFGLGGRAEQGFVRVLGRRLLMQGQQLQGVVARIHQGQRQQPRPGLPHGGGLDGIGGKQGAAGRHGWALCCNKHPPCRPPGPS